MAEKKSTQKVLLILLAVGAGVVLLCCGGIFFLLPGIWDSAKLEIEAEMAIEAEMVHEKFINEWRPPSNDITAEDLFPPKVEDFILQSHDESNTSIISLSWTKHEWINDGDTAKVTRGQTNLEGRHATYVNADGAKIEVYVYHANRSVKQRIYGSVISKLKDKEKVGAFKSRLILGSSTSNRLRYDITPLPDSDGVKQPPDKGYLLWQHEWLFFARTHDDADLFQFSRSYLEAIQPEMEIEQDAASP